MGIGIMEKKMETTIMGYIGIIAYILGLPKPPMGFFAHVECMQWQLQAKFRVWGKCTIITNPLHGPRAQQA